MDLSHRFTVPTAVEETWAHFQDIASVAECFPGAQVTSAEEDAFTGTVKVKLGPIALVYGGSGTFVEKDESAHRFVVDAKGKDKRGNGTAGAKVTLSMTSAGTGTDVEVLTDLAVTGKPAQFGRGVMQDVSDKLLGQFVACLEQRLGSDEGADHGSEASGAVAPAPTTAVAPVAEPDTAPAAPPPVSAVPTPPDPAPVPAPDAGTGSAPQPPPGPVEPPDAGLGAASPPAAATPAPATPAPARPAPARPAPARPAPAKADDAINLGSTVLPILLKSYWKQGLAVLVVIAVVVLLIAL